MTEPSKVKYLFNGQNSLKRESGISMETENSFTSPSKNGTQHHLAKEVMVELPLAHFRRLISNKELGSYDKETQFFTDVTTMHGPLRVYIGRSYSGWFWSTIMLFSSALLIYQIVSLVSIYIQKPVVSQVSFLIEENGMEFPVVTLCNFNPIKKSFVTKMNLTGQFPEAVVDYLLQSNVEMQALYSNANKDELLHGEMIYKKFKEESEPNITVDNFFLDGGHECSDLLKICSFGGRKFDCCEHVEPILTPLGRCFSLDLTKYGQPWMWKQSAAGEYNGLQIILDAQLDELYNGSGNESDPVFTNSFENGFRYFIHAPNTVSFIASEGISVSPGNRVYSSIASTNYVLLPKEQWGSCTREWPTEFQSEIPYSSGNCALLCKAKFYQDRCGCTPFMYNLDFKNPTCTPYEMFTCMESTRITERGNSDFSLPDCSLCRVECESWQFHSYNSYGYGFSEGALRWLNERNPTWTIPHIRTNFLAVSVFFKDLTYTQYNQIQGASITETLSDIGGNMGLCFGMSVITITEILIYLVKMAWITVSTNRRHYLHEKKMKEKQKEEALEVAASSANINSLSHINTTFHLGDDNSIDDCDSGHISNPALTI